MNTAGTGPQPVDFADVRATNLAVVLRYVRTAAPCSRADIAASTGLTKATVSSLVAELLDRRMLRETGLTENRIGRPATMLAIDGSGYVGLGVEVGVDHLTAVAVDLADRRVLTWRRSFVTPGRRPGRVIAEVATLTRHAAARVQAEGGTVVGFGVAVPGLVDSAGVVRRAPALDWTDVELRAGVVRALRGPDYPVSVDTSARFGAVAEYRYGALAGTAHLAYLAGPPGGGVGVINGGVPLRGANGYGGVLVELDALLERGDSGAPDLTLQGVEVEQLARRAHAGEQPVLAGLREMGCRLGRSVAVLVDLLDPAAVVLGGSYGPVAPWLLPAVAHEVRQIAPRAGAVRLAASTLGHEAAALGAAALPLTAIGSARATFPDERN